MCLTVSLTIAKTWRQPGRAAVGETVDTLWSVHAVEHRPEQNKRAHNACGSMNEPQMHSAKQGKKPGAKGHRRYDIISMTFWKRQDYRDIKQISDCWYLGQGEYLTSEELHPGILQAMEHLCMMMWCWIHNSKHLSKPIELIHLQE